METYSLAKILHLHLAGGVLFTKPTVAPADLLEKDPVSQDLAAKWQAYLTAKEELLFAIEAAENEVNKQAPSHAKESMHAFFEPSCFNKDTVNASQADGTRLYMKIKELHPDSEFDAPKQLYTFSDGSGIQVERTGFSMNYTIIEK